MKTFILTIFSTFLLFLTSCETGVEMPHYHLFRFDNKVPYIFNAKDITIIDNSQSETSAMFNILPFGLAEQAKTWTRDRIKLQGNGKYMRVTIKDATIKEKPLAKDKSFSGNFYKQQDALYVSKLEVEFEIFDKDPLFPIAETEITVTVSKSLEEGSSLNKKREFMYQLIEETIQKFDNQVDVEFPKYFSSHLAN